MVSKWRSALCLLCFVVMAATSTKPRCIMYLTGQHNVVPENSELRSNISHVILAFMRSEIFNTDDELDSYPLFTSVAEVRRLFPHETKIMIAVGGWGNSEGFEEAAHDAASRQRWAKSVQHMVAVTGADGVDIDWEYPGGNRDDYKAIPNTKRLWEIDAFQLLLKELRHALGRERILSIAVPGLERDMMAFTPVTVPKIVEQVDFINIMTYDLINRRDTTVKHHSGIADSRASIQRYLDRGVPRSLANLGIGYYVKWVLTEDCNDKADDMLRCRTQLLEDPNTGEDLGRIAAFSWHDAVPDDLDASFARALASGRYFPDGSYAYWDEADRRWWTFDTVRVMEQKMRDIVGAMELGGVFAWGLGEDGTDFSRLAATVRGVHALQAPTGTEKDEL